MPRAALAFGVSILVLLSVAGLVAAPAAAQEEAVPRVLLLSLPGTTWAAMDQARTPNLQRLLSDSAVASASVRTIRRRTRTGDGYATIGAGTAAAGVAPTDGFAFDTGEEFEEGTAGEAYTRRLARAPGGKIVSLATPALVADAARRHRGAEIGALGDALGAAGVGRAVIGNADLGWLRRPLSSFHREVALALADQTGSVESGTVARELLRRDPLAPFGVRLDPTATVAAFRAAWTASPRGVVVVEASDLARAHAFYPATGATRHAAIVSEALESTDALVGALLAEVDPTRDAVMVVAPSDPGDGVHLTVAALRAPGVEPGRLVSASTRRAGFVTLTDVAPTILRLLGLPRPDSMEGRSFEVAGSSRSNRAVAGLIEADGEARFRDRMFVPVSTGFVTIEIILSLATAIALARATPAGVRAALSLIALGLLAVVPASYLSAVLDITSPSAYFALIGGGALILALAANGLARLRWVKGGGVVPERLWPIGALLGLLFGLLLADVVTGSQLQLSTVFGYSPTVGGRFAGFGNLAFAQLAAGAALLASILAHAVGGRQGAQVAIAVLVVALVADGMPMWGSDVGGVLSAVPAFALVAFGLTGARFSPRRAVALAGAAVAAVVAFGGLDLLRSPDQRSHLGRLFERIAQDGLGPLGEVIERKTLANLAVLPQSIFVPLVPAVLAFLAWLAWGSAPRLEAVRNRVPELRPATAGVLVAAVLGFALNDSGIAVPAMMLGVLNPVLVYLALHWD